LDVDQRVQVGRELLSQSGRGPADEPDRPLRFWFDAQGPDVQHVWQALLTDESLLDDQRRRVWLQVAESRALSSEFLRELLPKVFIFGESEATQREILSSRPVIDEAFGTSHEARYGLSQILLRSFAGAVSLESKNGLLDWIADLRTTPVLKELELYDVSDTDRGLLRSRFSRSRDFQNWERRHPASE